MFLSIWRCITLMFSAQSLTMTSAHVLELPQKMQYDAHMYAAVNTTLYRYFAIVGGFYTVTSILLRLRWRFWFVSADQPSDGRLPGPSA